MKRISSLLSKIRCFIDGILHIKRDHAHWVIPGELTCATYGACEFCTYGNCCTGKVPLSERNPDPKNYRHPGAWK